MTIEELNELTGDILDAKSMTEILAYRIEQIEKPDSKFHARLDLEINNNKRGASSYGLNKDEVLTVLRRQFTQAKNRLLELTQKYNTRSQ